MHAATYPVHPEPFTIEDLYALPDDGMRHELIDGALLVTPPPSGRHQLVVTELTIRFAAAAPPKLRVVEGPGIRLTSSRVLQPDLVIGHRGELSADVLYFPPHAVAAAVEVVSPSNAATDRITKPALYAEAGIPTFLRVELAGLSAPEVYAYRLDSGTYRECGKAHAGERFELDEPFPISFDPADLTAP